jgi:hypothetical protein
VEAPTRYHEISAGDEDLLLLLLLPLLLVHGAGVELSALLVFYH